MVRPRRASLYVIGLKGLLPNIRAVWAGLLLPMMAFAKGKCRFR